MIAWFGNAAIVISVWRLGDKKWDGWIWSVVGNSLWAAYGIQHQIWSIVFIDGVMLYLAFRNLEKWK